MPKYKVTAREILGSIKAPSMYVEAKNEEEAKRHSRLNDFPKNWKLTAFEIVDKMPKGKKIWEE